jgi:hypothetical protein
VAIALFSEAHVAVDVLFSVVLFDSVTVAVNWAVAPIWLTKLSVPVTATLTTVGVDGLLGPLGVDESELEHAPAALATTPMTTAAANRLTTRTLDRMFLPSS